MALLEQLDDVIRGTMEQWDVPGVSVGILHDGAVEFAGHGIANVDTGAPVAPETLFQIGSISKVFTATLLMTLVDEGRLDIEAPVITYVPELVLRDPQAREQITVRHLLTHMAGFYGDRFDAHGEGDDALQRAVAAFADLPQQTRPGELWTYCNAGIDLLGRAMENILGMPFERAMSERVLIPMGLEWSTYFAREAIMHSVAVGHAGRGGEPVQTVSPWPVPRRTNPAGGVISNVLELLRFAGCHMNDGQLGGTRIISAKAAQAMRTIQTPADFGRSWGFGWLMRQVGSTHTVEHGGATNGFTARLLTVPERMFAIAVLTNHDDGAAVHGAIVGAALKRFLDLEAPVPVPVEIDPASLARLQGRFRHGLADIEFKLEGDGLVMRRTDFEPFRNATDIHPVARVLPISATEVMVMDGLFEGAVAEFFWNADGSPRFIRMGGRLGHPVA
ncbi:MAG: serine hydrolase domain-containing protein [Thermomicrobiales bacterium]